MMGRWLRTMGASAVLVLAAWMGMIPPAIADDPVPAPDASATTVDSTVDPSVSLGIGEALEEEIVPVVRTLVFPVVGATWFSDGFGECRDGCTRLHQGIDILTFGWKGVPVVAAHDGVVTRLSIDGELAGCSLSLESDDGWSTRYLHLNTDVPGTDRPGTTCFAPGIEVGAAVRGGTLLGWVGDTGNAEETPPHLHFEIRDDEGTPVDPWESLRAASHISFEWIAADDGRALVTTAFTSPQSTVYVVDVDEFDSIVGGSDQTVTFDAPVIAYDSREPGPARSAIRDFNPTRIIVLTATGMPPFIGDLRILGSIVEVANVGGAPVGTATQETSVGSDDRTNDVGNSLDPAFATVSDLAHAVVDPAFATMIFVGTASPTSEWADIIDAVQDPAVPLVIVGGVGPRDVGQTAPEVVPSEEFTDGLWWLTSDGWRHTLTGTAPRFGVAYVPTDDLDVATVAFLISWARAPAMPLWNHQPTSRDTRSP